MLNPDGVINGNHRCSLAGRDLNREWQYPSRHTTPPVYYFKALMKHVKKTRDVLLFTDFHGHSKHKNFFIYGCNALRKGSTATPSLVLEKVLPKLMQNLTPSFSLENTSFKVQKAKESTGRVVVWREIGVRLSYTIEASLMGSDALPVLPPDDIMEKGEDGSVLPPQTTPCFETKAGHYNTAHYQSIGAVFCRVLRPFLGNDKDTPAILALGETVHQLCASWNVANGSQTTKEPNTTIPQESTARKARPAARKMSRSVSASAKGRGRGTAQSTTSSRGRGRGRAPVARGGGGGGGGGSSEKAVPSTAPSGGGGDGVVERSGSGGAMVLDDDDNEDDDFEGDNDNDNDNDNENDNELDDTDADEAAPNSDNIDYATPFAF